MIHNKIRIFLALIFCLLFSILSLPIWLSAFRPPLIFLLVLYIQLFKPNYFSLTALLILGLCLDVLMSTVLGEHVFALVFCAWLVSGKARRFSFFPMTQQILLVGLLTLIYQSILFLINGFWAYQGNFLMPLASTAAAMLFWPWLKILADGSLFERGYSPQPR